MTSLLLMIELTVAFYATMVIWQVGTHQSAVPDCYRCSHRHGIDRRQDAGDRGPSIALDLPTAAVRDDQSRFIVAAAPLLRIRRLCIRNAIGLCAVDRGVAPPRPTTSGFRTMGNEAAHCLDDLEDLNDPQGKSTRQRSSSGGSTRCLSVTASRTGVQAGDVDTLCCGSNRSLYAK
jgi:hypothetical protein